MKASRWLHPLLAAVVLAVAAVCLAVTDLDLEVADRYYRLARDRWPVGDGPPWTWLEDYGTIPAFVLLGVGVVLLVRG